MNMEIIDLLSFKIIHWQVPELKKIPSLIQTLK